MDHSNYSDNLNGVILLDLKKAFDLIDHDILIHKHKLYKCAKILVRWFSSHLKGWRQWTVFKGKQSEKLPIKTGVPQGSRLGPLLFIFVISDLPKSLKETDADM